MANISFPIEFRLAEGESVDPELLTPPLQQIFQYCNQFIDLPKAALERVVLTNPARMSETIYEFQDKAGRSRGHTEGYLQTAGKAIPRVTEEGGVVNTLVIDLRIMLALIAACQQETPLEDWDVDTRFWFSVLIVTVGHCIDNAVRGDVADRTLDPEGDDDYLTLARYYVPTVVGQFVAGVLAGPVFTTELQNREITNWQTTVRTVVDPLVDRKFYVGGLPGLMTDVTHTFWGLLTQYAGLVGHTVSNPELGEVPVSWTYREEEEPALRRIAEYLRQLWTEYPNLPSEDSLVENLLPQWQALTASHGFIFREGDDEEDDDRGEAAAG